LRKENEITTYEIRVKGHLDERWSEWFGGLEFTNLENGEAVLYGTIVDQAALHGLLTRVLRDLGLPLIAVRSVGPVPTVDIRRFEGRTNLRGEHEALILVETTAPKLLL
jgi:hypothetical protein